MVNYRENPWKQNQWGSMARLDVDISGKGEVKNDTEIFRLSNLVEMTTFMEIRNT